MESKTHIGILNIGVVQAVCYDYFEKMQKSYAFYLEIEKIAVYLHSENEQMV